MKLTKIDWEQIKGVALTLIVTGIVVGILVLAGCAPMPEQKLGDGQVGCFTVTGVYGSASSVVMRADNVPKGSGATGDVRITCGSAVMEIKSTVMPVVPAPAVKPVSGGAP